MIVWYLFSQNVKLSLYLVDGGYLVLLYRLIFKIILVIIERKKDLLMTLKGTRTGETKCSNAEAAIEYINKRPTENFVIYDATKSIINQIKNKVKNTITEG